MNATLIGYLEEEPGVKSMARLGVAVTLSFSAAIIAAICYVAVRKTDPAATITALGVVLGTLMGGAWAQLRERTPTKPPAA